MFSPPSIGSGTGSAYRRFEPQVSAHRRGGCRRPGVAPPLLWESFCQFPWSATRSLRLSPAVRTLLGYQKLASGVLRSPSSGASISPPRWEGTAALRHGTVGPLSFPSTSCWGKDGRVGWSLPPAWPALLPPWWLTRLGAM